MALPALVIWGLVAAGAAGVTYTGQTHYSKSTKKAWRKDVDEVYSTYLKNARKTGADKINTKDALEWLRTYDYISTEDYDLAVQEYKEFEKQYADGDPDWIYNFASTGKKFKALKNAYQKLNEHSNAFAKAAKLTATDLKGVVKDHFEAAAGKIRDIDTPSYFDTDFANEIQSAEPMRLMTGKEMAELHNIDYDPNTYYDLIKQGTQADIAYTDYLSRQMNEASMIEDTKNVNSYLDSIRNNKAEALASGATAGARAAQEVLAQRENISNYANNQLNVASERYNTVEEALINDAQAKLTARDYFNNIAQSLATDAMTLYASDAERYAAEQMMYANIFDANEYLRQERIKANGEMAGAYAANQANVNAARGSLKDQESELAFIIDRVFGANGHDPIKSFNQLDKITRKDTLGYSSYFDNYNTYYK